jgi:hypothetical protein
MEKKMFGALVLVFIIVLTFVALAVASIQQGQLEHGVMAMLYAGGVAKAYYDHTKASV